MRTLAFVMSLGFVLWPSAMPATFAQEAARVLGTIERVEGDKFVLKWSDKAALVLTLADGADEMTEGQGAIATNAKSFLEYQYVEIKDLSKEFLAVIAGILALSVTFSEKIIDLPTASLFTKGLLIAIWVGCFSAFALGGLAIFLIYNAGIAAKYAAVHHEVIAVPFTYQELTFWAQWALTVGGLAFSAALALLASVGAIRVFQKKAPSESNVES